EGLISSDVALPTATVLLVAVTLGATWFAGHKLRTLTLAGEE
ncbi:ABC transporter permease, partial [Streptomyces sp. NPDC058757]